MGSVIGLTSGWRRWLRSLIGRARELLTRPGRSEAAESVHLAPVELRSEVALASATHFYQRRQVLVASDLGMLRGPVGGQVRLPELLKWSGDENAAWFNLDDPEQRPTLYVAVLRDALAPSELGEWLDGGWLVELWPRLVLPPEVRAAWEQQHRVLLDVGTGRRLAS